MADGGTSLPQLKRLSPAPSSVGTSGTTNASNTNTNSKPPASPRTRLPDATSNAHAHGSSHSHGGGDLNLASLNDENSGSSSGHDSTTATHRQHSGRKRAAPVPSVPNVPNGTKRRDSFSRMTLNPHHVMIATPSLPSLSTAPSSATPPAITSPPAVVSTLSPKARRATKQARQSVAIPSTIPSLVTNGTSLVGNTASGAVGTKQSRKTMAPQGMLIPLSVSPLPPTDPPTGSSSSSSSSIIPVTGRSRKTMQPVLQPVTAAHPLPPPAATTTATVIPTPSAATRVNGGANDQRRALAPLPNGAATRAPSSAASAAAPVSNVPALSPMVIAY